MDAKLSVEEIAAIIRKEADMAQRVCGFVTGCNSLMEHEVEEILQEIFSSDDPTDVSRFIFTLAGLTAGLLGSLSSVIGHSPETIISRFAILNEVSEEESLKQAATILKAWEDSSEE